MKIYRLPKTIEALAFDMDLTLYSHPEYGQSQIDLLVERLGERRGCSFEEMDREIEGARKSWAAAHGGKIPSLSNVLMTFGVTMEENIRWREELYEPARYIQEDSRLKQTLEVLSRGCILGVVTNNPVLVARKTLAALGVEDCFSILIGLDTCFVPKPHEKPFLKFSELSQCPPETCVSIGDRYDIDLDIPLGLGMGGILVKGVEDVYEIPSLWPPTREIA